jgi:triosephosphate isomerase
MAAKPRRRPLVAGNWKMNLTHLEAIALVQKLAWTLTPAQLQVVETAVLPPFTDLRSVQTLIDGDRLLLVLGAQDVSAHDKGAYTGEISGVMLAALGVRYVVVGHSERRQYHHEDDALVAAKAQAAFRHGLVPIVCVGEQLAVREAGDQVAHCTSQLKASLDGLTAEQVATAVVAYEPVWAIGTGKVAGPREAQEVCAALRTAVAELFGDGVAQSVRLLYGGSVKASNAAELFGERDIDGALVGGASLVVEDFAGIVRAATV